MRIAIIGAGVCGLYLAWKLAKKGENVTVFEKNSSIGNKICSGLYSERILEFIPDSKKLIEHEINSVVIYFPKKRVKVNFSKKILVIDRIKLDNLLLNLSQSAGAKIFFNQNISELPENFERIIGCDGANSFIRKYLKAPELSMRLGIQGSVNPSTGSGQVKENFVETWPCNNGFLWKISRAGKTEYGIIGNSNEAYKIFTDFLQKNKISLKDIKARIIPQGFAIPKNPSINSGQAQVTLCGDAAGLTKPWSGGGVIWGLTAANLLIETFPDFKNYSKKTKKFFSFKILKSKFLTKIVYFLGFHLPFLLPKNNKIESDFLT